MTTRAWTAESPPKTRASARGFERDHERVEVIDIDDPDVSKSAYYTARYARTVR